MTKSSGGYVAKLLDTADQFYKTSFKQFEFQRKLMGTKVLVTRVTEDSRRRQVFGSLYTSNLQGGRDTRSFEYTVLINMNDMKNLYQRNIEILEFFDTKKVLDMGDVFSYVRAGREYKFKITKVETWADNEDILYKYTIQGLIETDTNSNGNC